MYPFMRDLSCCHHRLSIAALQFHMTSEVGHAWIKYVIWPCHESWTWYLIGGSKRFMGQTLVEHSLFNHESQTPIQTNITKITLLTLFKRLNDKS